MNLTRRSLLATLPLLPAARALSAAQDGPPPPVTQRAASQPGARPFSAPQDAPPQPPAASKEGQPTFSGGVKVVNVFATVRDKKNQIVKGLTQDDFLLDEDGRPQTIKYFSQESNLPLNLGLLVDTSMSQRNVLDSERSASRQFLEQVLRADRDLAFVIHFDAQIELLQDLTADRPKLEKAIDLCAPSDRPQLQQGGGQQGGGQQGGGQQGGGYPGGGYPGGSRYPGGGRRSQGGGGGTALYDAIYLASDEVIKKQQGRKALILLTDGVDRHSKYTLSMAIEAAQRADTLVYSILFADPNGYGRSTGFGGPGMGRRRGMGYPGGGYPGGGGGYERTDGKKVLQQIAAETGGRFFEVSKKLPIDKVYGEIEEELRSQYSIGYTSDRASEAGGLYRKIHLTVKKKDLVVQARDGYYAS